MLPTLPLIDQTLAVYRRSSAAFERGRILVVASDCADPDATVTTDAAEIAAFLSANRDALVVSTYDSLARVAEGARITPFVITIALMPDIEPPVSRVNRTPARVRVSQMDGV